MWQCEECGNEEKVEEWGFKIMQSVYVQEGYPEQERLEKEMLEMVRRQMIGDVHPEQERLEKEMLEMVRRQVWSNGVEWELV